MELPEVVCYHFATIMSKNMVQNQQPKNNQDTAKAP
jgi:hypothetical protein